ncbi:hypothetical protein SYNTR_0369 [Candidatus Syntrophocurvum alkaliphilum]|uniref:Small integral membrane protein n=1 Tax=Candidatus Syntrophocurvum alkaliphilum TaxID=2293317 RepID=A0A6I6DDU0_9FIRM|nr:DUF2273 domain-containing protein [Candidatus Syntrophocurvum alkaliphilum]QGT98962.1 hypothetical protein SYNTR_0369 [Candidatus Syntrophocurvum alkaliphilum]
MWEKILLSMFQEHRGKVVGVLLGLVASILFITYGFLKAIFIIFCIVLGYLIGKRLDENKGFEQWLHKMFKEK